MTAQTLDAIIKVYRGLTIRLGDKEINVHFVDRGKVGYGLYIDGQDMPIRLIQLPEDEFRSGLAMQLQRGAVLFSLIAPQHNQAATDD